MEMGTGNRSMLACKHWRSGERREHCVWSTVNNRMIRVYASIDSLSMVVMLRMNVVDNCEQERMITAVLISRIQVIPLQSLQT